jgi:NAD-dependent deacetylase
LCRWRSTTIRSELFQIEFQVNFSTHLEKLLARSRMPEHFEPARYRRRDPFARVLLSGFEQIRWELNGNFLCGFHSVIIPARTPYLNMVSSHAMLTKLLSRAERIVFFTGAGVSTESGLADFRSAGGIWSRYDPADFTFSRFVSDEDVRRRYWAIEREIYAAMKAATPNAAHRAMAFFEARGQLAAVVTQNIDGLHQRGGVSPENVIELHVTALDVVCLRCAARGPREPVEARLAAGDALPRCETCNGILKPATVMFGEMLPDGAFERAAALAESCDLCVVVGSSLVVTPAAHIPAIAVDAGAPLVIMNRTPTPLDSAATLVIREPAATTLGAVAIALQSAALS